MNEILDGFDHYGSGSTGRTNMLNGVWSEVASVITPTTTRPRTGTHSLHCTGSVNSSLARRVFPTEGAIKYLEPAWYVTNTPVSDEKMCLGQFRSAANTPLVSFVLSTTGSIQIRQGLATGTVLAESGPLAFLPSSWQHVGMMAHMNGAASSAEVRVNGVVVASVSGVNLGSDNIAQFAIGQTQNGIHGTGDWFCDDLRTGDDQGGINDDFMGDRRVITQFPDADGLHQDFTPLSGSDAYAMVDETAPDGDVSYIDGADVGDLCQMGFPDLPAEVVAINGVAFATYARKTDVGDASITVNVVAGVASPQAREVGAEHVLNVTYNYLPLQVFDQDPDAEAPWTPAAVNNSYVEIDRTA